MIICICNLINYFKADIRQDSLLNLTLTGFVVSPFKDVKVVTTFPMTNKLFLFSHYQIGALFPSKKINSIITTSETADPQQWVCSPLTSLCRWDASLACCVSMVSGSSENRLRFISCRPSSSYLIWSDSSVLETRRRDWFFIGWQH